MKKKKQSKVVGVELRAGGGLHGPEKPGWSAGDMVKYPGNQMKIQQQNETLTNEVTQHQKRTTAQKPPGGSSEQVSSLWVFDFWL